MTELFALVGLLGAAFVASTLMSGQGRRLLLPSGGEWLLVGFVLGPTGLDLVGPHEIATLEPVLVLGIAWFGLMLGLFFGNVRGTEEPRGTRPWTFVAALVTVVLGFVLLSLILPRVDPAHTEPIALALIVCATAGSRSALRWIRRFRVDEDIAGPRAKVLAALAQWDNLLAVVGIAALHLYASHAWTADQGVVTGAIVVLGTGATLGALGAALLGRELDTAGAWGTVLGLVLLGVGISLRLDHPPITAMFVLGFVLVRLSPVRAELRAMVGRTETPAVVIVLIAAGASVDLQDFAVVPWLLPAFLVSRALARTVGGMILGVLPVSGSLRLGLASLAIGPLAVALALHVHLRDPASADGSLLLAILAGAALLSEIFAPLTLHRALLRGAEIGRFPRATAQLPGPTVDQEPDDENGEPDHALDEQHHAPPSGLTAIRVVILIAIYAVLYLAVRLSPGSSGYGPAIAGLGLLTLGGTLAGQIMERARLPRVTGYLLAGLAAGPQLLVLVDEASVEQLRIVNGLALSLLALEAGGELSIRMLRHYGRSLTFGMLAQVTVVVTVLTGAFVVLSPWVPFAAEMPLPSLLGFGLLWGVVGVSMSPAAALAVLSETHARGHVARVSLGIVVIIEVGALLLLALALPVSERLIDSSESISVTAVGPIAHELLGSIALGTTLGMLLGACMLLVRGQLLLLLVVIGFFGYEFSAYLGFDSMLVFIAAGFVVRNLTPYGYRMLGALEGSAVIMVIFFANAGASLDLDAMVRLWPVVVAFCAIRVVALSSAGWLGGVLARDPPPVTRWAWTGFVSQGVLAVALAIVVGQNHPTIAAEFYDVVLAVLGLNLLVGPMLYRLGLGRAKEIRE